MLRSHLSGIRNNWTRIAVLVILAVLVPTLALVLAPAPVRASGFAVNNVQDLPDVSPGNGICDVFEARGVCTLRAAIMEANALDGDDTITLPAGTFTLTRPGAGENGALTGDLDVTDFGNKLTIIGAGAAFTHINGGEIDRVFHVFTFSTLEISGVTITMVTRAATTVAASSTAAS